MSHNYFVKGKDVVPYHPANHSGTSNYRLIGPDTVGQTGVEVLRGVIEKGKGAQPHAHPGIEQVCYLISGSATATVNGQTQALEAGDACYFPADAFHTFTVTSDVPAEVLVIYTPPYGESPDKVYKPGNR
ncbi:cupin domain-containing protein [Bordetella trematum]|uniref:cupin domain-containing protein n=1 Tax=Bordetella trematum TaxID=123899 RepID=UPI003AF3F7F3